jgi:hypothetical protein
MQSALTEISEFIVMCQQQLSSLYSKDFGNLTGCSFVVPNGMLETSGGLPWTILISQDGSREAELQMTFKVHGDINAGQLIFYLYCIKVVLSREIKRLKCRLRKLCVSIKTYCTAIESHLSSFSSFLCVHELGNLQHVSASKSSLDACPDFFSLFSLWAYVYKYMPPAANCS